MARDQEGNEKTALFNPTDTFYAVVNLGSAPDDTKLKAIWTAVEVDGTDANSILGEREYSQGSGSVYFNLSNTQPWPDGRYKVDIYLNNELNQTLEFEVQGNTAEQPEPTAIPTAEQLPTDNPLLSEPQVSDVYLARDEDGLDRVTTFAQEDTLYAIVELINPSPTANLKAVWSVILAEGAGPGELLNETEITTTASEDFIRFRLGNDNLWPVGAYKVELFLNGSPITTLEFDIQAAQTSAADYVRNVYMTNDPTNDIGMVTFTPTDIFYCIVETADAPEGSVFRIEWIAAQVEGTDPDYVIDEAEYIQAGNGTITFSLGNDQPWPTGSYRIELYVNEERAIILYFEVQ